MPIIKECSTVFKKRKGIIFTLLLLKKENDIPQKWSLTQYPCREFVKQRIIDFSEEYPDSHPIHDNDPQFVSIDYSQYNIKAVKTCVSAPNMNTHVERVIGTIRKASQEYHPKL